MPGSHLPQRYAPTDLDDTNLKAGAGIATSKLADGANFVKRDGSIPFTGGQSMGNNNLTNVATGTANDHAVNLGQLNTLIAGLNSAYKYRTVRAASTANVTISNPGFTSLDGVTLTSGDALLGSILLKNQTAPAENGLYQFNGSAVPLSRLTNADTWGEFPGSLVFVNEGTTQLNTRWQCTSDDGGTLGSTAITYTQDNSNGLTTANFVFDETPSGTVNGTNTAFTLANTPTAGTVRLHIEGHRLMPGSGNDYTISGGTITMLTAPLTGERLRADYMK